MDESILDFNLPTDKTKNIIKVIGVGGGGGNAVHNMYKQGIKDVSFAICNTDSQALWKSDIPVKVQLGKTGLGAGGNPERAKIAAKDAFAKADDILTTATKGIAEIITIVGTISCDFCDVETVMKNGGNALMAIGRASGEKRLQKAIINALHSPLLSNSNIENAKKILFIIYTSEEHSLLIEEFDELDAFMEELNPDIEVIWGLYDDNSLDTDVKFTIIATGFETEERVNSIPEENKEQKYGEMIDRLYGKRGKKESPHISKSTIQTPPEESEEPKETPEPIDPPTSGFITSPPKPSLAERLLQRFGNIIDEMTRDE